MEPTNKVREVIPAGDGWSVVLPAEGAERVRFLRVACWAVIEEPSGARKVEPLVGGSSRTLEMAPSSALGIASPGETPADWRERLRAARRATRSEAGRGEPERESDDPPRVAAPPAKARATEPGRRSGEGEVPVSRPSGKSNAAPKPPADDEIMGASVLDDDD